MTPPLYFRDEAEEGEESVSEEEEQSEQEEGVGVSRTGVPLTNQGQKALKICRHFSYSLIFNAVDMGWEEQEVANLIKLVANQLQFDETKLIRCLEKTGTGSPATIACLLENSGFSFSAAQLVSVILSNARNVDHFITLMGEAFECDLFNLAHPETIDTLYSFIENNMDYRESQRYARQLCEHSDSKKVCGRLLHKFTTHLTPTEAAAFIYDIITLDFFQDVRGSTKDMMHEIPRVRNQLEGLLSASHNLDKDGEIIDSDADSEGNLRDFVVDSDSQAGSEEDQSQGGSESDGGSEDAGSLRGGNGGNESGSDSEDNSDCESSRSASKHRSHASSTPKASHNKAKAKTDRQKEKRKTNTKNSKSSAKTQILSDEEDWASESSLGQSSQRQKRATGKASSTMKRDSSGSSSGSNTSGSQHKTKGKKASPSANKNIKSASLAQKRKRIADDSESDTSLDHNSNSYNKKQKSSPTKTASSQKDAKPGVVVKSSRDRRIVLSDSDSESGNESGNNSASEESDVDPHLNLKTEGKKRTSQSASDSDSSDSSGSELMFKNVAVKREAVSGSSKAPASAKTGAVISGSSSKKITGVAAVKVKKEPAAADSSSDSSSGSSDSDSDIDNVGPTSKTSAPAAVVSEKVKIKVEGQKVKTEVANISKGIGSTSTKTAQAVPVKVEVKKEEKKKSKK